MNFTHWAKIQKQCSNEEHYKFWKTKKSRNVLHWTGEAETELISDRYKSSVPVSSHHIRVEGDVMEMSVELWTCVICKYVIVELKKSQLLIWKNCYCCFQNLWCLLKWLASLLYPIIQCNSQDRSVKRFGNALHFHLQWRDRKEETFPLIFSTVNALLNTNLNQTVLSQWLI